jgi:hypothetical protein
VAATLSKQNNSEGETWDRHQMRTMNQHHPKEKAETSENYESTPPKGESRNKQLAVEGLCS